jgi:helix-turn-helix protein
MNQQNQIKGISIMTDNEINIAIDNLINKGLVEVVVKDGSEQLQLTMLGHAYFEHDNSNKDSRN